MSARAPLTWLGIVRLGLVQTSLGAIFVLATSTLNRVMKVELALPAVLPGALIALQYWVQVLRPRLGHGSDIGARRTPYILGGMAGLAAAGVLAAVATALMARHFAVGLALAIAAFAAIGIGVSAAGTSLLVLLAGRTSPARRPAAATIVWLMMIMGFVVTAAVAGRLLDPFSPTRLVVVAAIVSMAALLVSCAAVWGVEGTPVAPASKPRVGFAAALREVWSEHHSRGFAVFVFVSMLAFGGEDLVIEPFAGASFAMSPGQTARLSGALHGGSLFGMVIVALVCGLARRSRFASLRVWMVGGCLFSGMALTGLAATGLAGSPRALAPLVFALGVANGAYAIAALATMMQLVGAGGPDRQGVRMGLWGAAQGVAFGFGSIAVTALSDGVRHLAVGQGATYAAVFALQATMFLVSAGLAARLGAARSRDRTAPLRPAIWPETG